MMQAASEKGPLTATRAVEAGAELRTAERYKPLIRTAKLIGASGEFLCVVSDVSTTGVSARLFHPLPKDKALCLEMPNGDQLPLETVWEEEGRAGFRFACPVNLDRVVEGRGEWPKRAIRLNIEMPVQLSGISGRLEGTLRNISSQGAQIECGSRLAIEQRLRLRGRFLPEIEAKVREKLEFVDLEPDKIVDSLPAELSGGMKKRVGIARGMANDPQIMLYDEPTSGLDPLTTGTITRLILKLQRELGVTSVVVSHDIRSSFRMGSRIALLADHNIRFFGTPEEMASSDDRYLRDFLGGY